MVERGKNRQRLLAEGLRLFAQQGYNATGVQQITDASDVPKGSFYNYFGSKEEFAVEVLKRYQQQECAELEQLLGPSEAAPLERLRGLFERWLDDMKAARFGGGCLAGRLAQELAGEIPQMRPPLDSVFTCMRSYVAECLREAQQAGELDDGMPAETLADFILNAWQGALQRAKAAGNEQPLRVCVDVLFDRVLHPGAAKQN